MKAIRRYDRWVIGMILAIISVVGVSLINSPLIRGANTGDHEANSLRDRIERQLEISFENSLEEMDASTAFPTLHPEIDKSYRIDNISIDEGYVFNIKNVRDAGREEILRSTLDILSGRYQRIRREDIKSFEHASIIDIEEHGDVFNELNTYSYINKLIMNDQEAWLFVMTFRDEDSLKIREFLDTIARVNEKKAIEG